MRISPFFCAGVAIFRRPSPGQSRWDFDGIDSFPPFLPVFAIDPLHVWDWHMQSTEWSWEKRTSQYAFRSIPIRWTYELLLRTILRIWLWLPLLTGLMVSTSCAHGLLARMAGFLLFTLSLAGLVVLWMLNARDRNIRLLLGWHRLGRSDPATWSEDLLAIIAPATVWFKMESFAAAAEALLREQRYSDAMWAARLTAALEDRQRGDELTNQILSDPAAQQELSRLRSLDAAQPRPYPLVRNDASEASQFWYARLFDGAAETVEHVQYAGHIGGMLAAAFEPDPPNDDAEFEQELAHRERREPRRREFFLAGLGVVAGVIVLTTFFVMAANVFRLPNAAEREIQRMRQRGS
jgi:hypothetical protein